MSATMLVESHSWAFGWQVQIGLTRAPLSALDKMVLLSLHDRAIPSVTRFFAAFTRLGNVSWVVLLLSLVTLVLLVQKRWVDSLVLITSAGGAAAVTAVVK